MAFRELMIWLWWHQRVWQHGPVSLEASFQPAETQGQLEIAFKSVAIRRILTLGVLPFFLEVVQGVNKAYGIDRLAKFYHILTLLIMFGDQHNSCLWFICWPMVCMANASEPLKAIANDITIRNDKLTARYGWFLSNYKSSPPILRGSFGSSGTKKLRAQALSFAH